MIYPHLFRPLDLGFATLPNRISSTSPRRSRASRSSPFAERLRRAGAKVVLEPRRPQIAGIERDNVVSYVDVLEGRVEPGRDVVIIGMGGIGFDVALYLLERRSASTLDPRAFASHWGISPEGAIGPVEKSNPRHNITMLKRSHTPFGHTLGRSTGWVHRAELARNAVRMIKGVEYRKIDDAGVHISVDGKEMSIAADTVIVCAGQEPRREVTGHHVIGGAKEATELDAKRAMLEGAELAARL